MPLSTLSWWCKFSWIPFLLSSSWVFQFSWWCKFSWIPFLLSSSLVCQFLSAAQFTPTTAKSVSLWYRSPRDVHLFCRLTWTKKIIEKISCHDQEFSSHHQKWQSIPLYPPPPPPLLQLQKMTKHTTPPPPSPPPPEASVLLPSSSTLSTHITSLSLPLFMNTYLFAITAKILWAQVTKGTASRCA